MLDHLTANKSYEQAVAGLDLLTAPESLEAQLQAFLLSCRVDELSPTTIQNYRYQIGSFLRFHHQLNLTPGGEVTVHHIRLFLLKLQDKNSPISVRDYYKSLRRFFNWLVEEGLLERTPMTTIHPPRIPKKIIRPFSPQDIDNLLLLCSGNHFLDIRNRAIILVFLDTGLRLAELAGIQLRDIDFGRETIKVMGKGAKERVVRIGKTAQRAVLKYLLLRNDSLPCLWVTEERSPFARWGIQSAIKRLCHRAEIVGAKRGPHSFRHTFGTQAFLNGADIREVQSLLGHSTLKTTLTYLATVDSEVAVKRHREFSPVDRMKLK